MPSLGKKGRPERLLILPDTHAPFEDRQAWNAMLDFAKDFKPDTIVHLGDLADFYCVSEHDKDPRRAHNLVEESQITNNLLDQLDGLKAKRKVFCTGNHEQRAERAIMRHVPGLAGAVSVDSLLHLTKRGWHVEPYMEPVKIGKLMCVHDIGRSGANAVRQAAVATGSSIITGHGHRLESLYFGTTTGERHVSAMAGWLGLADEAKYTSPVNKAAWQHGFATALMEASGDFLLSLVPIVDGRIIAL